MTFLWCVFLALSLILVLELGLADQSQGYCTTHDDKPGRCTRNQDCPYIAALENKLKKNLTSLTAEENYILKNSRQPCLEFHGTVCCKDFVNPKGLELLQQQEANCGKFEEYTVAGGYEIRMGSRPWMALLQFSGRRTVRDSFECGATVITPHFFRMSIRLGEHNISSPTDCKAYGKVVLCQPPYEDVPVSVHSSIIHKDFESSTLRNDIALIRLPREIIFQNHSLLGFRPICLPLYHKTQQGLRRSEWQRVTGWGMIGQKVSNVPNEAQVALMRENCTRSLLGNQLCVEAYVRDSCEGDSGGPLAYPYLYKNSQRFVQLGIVSYGPIPCAQGTSAVYTDVTRFVPWITQNIKP
ncbi:hypothetical protein KR054_001459 [Drosophila jambulina]|nr:hypothetical protein KR054_001459 [Drosophila jambulina]